MSITVFKDISRLYGLTENKELHRRGDAMDELPFLEDQVVVVEDGKILDILYSTEVVLNPEWRIISLNGGTVLPGFVECHTHTAFAGNRSAEFLMKLQGATYEEIAKAGGGILTTMNSVRTATEEDLLALMLPRISNYIRQGVTTLEIKSGYGLDTKSELTLLRAISRANKLVPIDIVPTFLGAHTFPPEFKQNRNGYIDLLINEMIPVIADESLASFCDGFCESTAFTPEEITRIFDAASQYGLALKLHTDQFNSIGGVETALSMNATSVDHLEVAGEKQIALMKDSPTAAVLLPGVSYFLNYQFAPARALIENDAIVALATDYNPGSSHIDNIFLIMSLAAIKMKMSINEIINAYTLNSAYALDRSYLTGSIEIGKQADFAVIGTSNLTEIIYNTAHNPVLQTISKGEIIFNNPNGTPV